MATAHTDATNKRAAQVSFNNAFNTFRTTKLSHPDFILPDPAPQTLKDDRATIESDLDTVLANRDKTEYATAEGLLSPLSNKIDRFIVARNLYVVARDKFLLEEPPVMTRAKAIAEMDDDIPDDKRLLKQGVVTLKNQIEGDVGNFAYAAAQPKLDDLKNNKLGPIETFKGQHDNAKPQFQNAWKSYKYQAEEVVKYPTGKAPDSFKKDFTDGREKCLRSDCGRPGLAQVRRSERGDGRSDPGHSAGVEGKA